MPSGRRETIVISCATLDTVRITDPIEHYRATKVHLIRYMRDSDELGEIYREFYDYVRKVCEAFPLKPGIKEHDGGKDFTSMLRTVLSIIRKERGADPECDIYVNISAGSPEYIAAAAIASMTDTQSSAQGKTIPFSVPVHTNGYMVKNDEIRTIYFENGTPVGIAKNVKDPEEIPTYRIEMPQEYLVRALRVLHEKEEKKQPRSNKEMIAALKGSGDMEIINELNVTDTTDKSNDKKKNSERVYYQRKFIDKWVSKEWVRKTSRKTYTVTDQGKTILKTFDF